MEFHMFASNYLIKNRFQPSISQAIKPDVGMILVIPCYQEPDILNTLDSLASCDIPACGVEIIIVVNHPEYASVEVKEFNIQTLKQIKNWVRNHSLGTLIVHAIGPVDLPRKWAGAGLARKRGMDEAISRFNSIDKPEGIIVSLDADTLVAKNYMVEIEHHFRNHPDHIGATISFIHQTEGLGERHMKGIKLYEKYLKYYKDAVAFTGYPWSMFTIGSAFMVKAGAYVKRGGMNRRKAGEDFYFLQNLAQIGEIGEITTSCVYPSARLSDRVPFGTGPIMKKWMEGKEDLMQTYNFQAFIDLRHFFLRSSELFRIGLQDYQSLLLNLPEPVSQFLSADDFWQEIGDLNCNCSKPEIFKIRFFQKFNAFKILKFLNFGHDKYYKKENIHQQINRLKEFNNQ